MGGSLRWYSVWRWARVLCICCSFVLLMPAQRSYASGPSDLMDSLRTHLLTISGQVTSLENESRILTALSAESVLQVNELQQELSALKQELEVLRISSEESRQQVESMGTSLRQSEEKLTLLSKTWLDSANSWKAVADAERRVVRRWKWVAVLAGAGALLVGGAIGYAVGK